MIYSPYLAKRGVIIAAMPFNEVRTIEHKIAGIEPAIILWKFLFPIFCYLRFLSYICIELFEVVQNAAIRSSCYFA